MIYKNQTIKNQTTERMVFNRYLSNLNLKDVKGGFWKSG